MTEPFVALSRVDNKTKICPECGTKEAFEAFIRWRQYLKGKEVGNEDPDTNSNSPNHSPRRNP